MWLLTHSVSVLVLFLVVAAVCRWSRLGPAARHALWLLVLLKLLTPPFIAWPWPLPVLPSTSSETVRQAAVPSARDDRREEAPRERIALSPAAIPNVEWNGRAMSPVKSGEAPSEQSLPMSHFEWEEHALDLAAAVWLGGALVVAIVQLIRLGRFQRWLGHARSAPPWLTSQVEELAALLGVRPPRVAVLPGLGSPLVWAGGQTPLLWPAGLEKELSPEGCRAVLAHELAHLARRDHWAAWMVFAAGCIWWWHPLLYLIRRRLHREAELACDAHVIALLPDNRRSYAEALLDVCQRQTRAVALAPALGVASRRRELERRLVMIMRANVASRLSPRMLLSICVLGLVLLPGWTLGKKDSPSKNAPTEQDRKMQELESKLQDILKDLEAKRKPTPQAVELALPSPSQMPQVVDLTFPVLSSAQVPQQANITWVLDQPAPVQQADRDKKIQEIEAKLQALLKEVRSLRNSKSTDKGKATSVTLDTVVQGIQLLNTNPIILHESTNDAIVDLFVVNQQPRQPVEVTLSRATYNLPTGKAEALGKLLKQHFKAAVMETKVEGDSLIVTTTPEAQQGIRQFIALMEVKTPQSGQQPKK